MEKISKQHLLKFLQTEAGEKALREAARIVSKEIVSAEKYYVGTPDGKYFGSDQFEENAVTAKKAYVTLNTLMGGETAEFDRFTEGKKQVPELITPLGVKKMVNLFMHLYCFASGTSSDITYETVKACRQSEVSEGESIVGVLTSTTKLSVEEIMKLGYGNKNKLAICHYKFHDGAAICDMEKLQEEYLKPEEREVLLLMGNKIVAHCLGYDERYIGKDGQPALIYEVDVYPPEFEPIAEKEEDIKAIVYNSKYLTEVRKFYEALNQGGEYPAVPSCYEEWKKSFRKLVFMELAKLA